MRRIVTGREWWLVVLWAWCAWGCTPAPAPNPGTAGREGATSRETSTGATTSGEGKVLEIGVVPKGTTHEFWKSVHAGAERAAQEMGNVRIHWKGPILENDTEGQISVVEDFVTKRVDGIVLAPNDSQALIGAVQGAKDAGIPTVIFDSALDNADIIVTYAATDNYKGGVLAAQRLAEALGQQGNVFLLRYKEGSESTMQREEGFLAGLKEYPDIKVLSDNQYAGTTPEQALDRSQQMLQKYKDTVNGVFTVCEPNGAGMLGALEDLELAAKVKFVTFDPSPRMVDALGEDKIHGIVLQDPVTMGYEAVKAMVTHLRNPGTTIAPRIDTGVYVATPDNMKEPQMSQLLHPVQFE